MKVSSKKISAIIALFLVLMPLASFAKTAILDSELAAITAQEGVTIDCGTGAGAGIEITNYAPSVLSWGDPNGFTDYTSAGYLGMMDISINEASSFGGANGLMDIDVGTSGSVTKLKIGLPMVQFYTTDINATVKLDTTKDLSSSQEPLGTVYVASLINYLNTAYDGVNPQTSLGGSITLSSHPTTQGISIGFDNVVFGVPKVATHVSWGDADGDGAENPSAGYVGLTQLTIGPAAAAGGFISDLITLTGDMGIDVGTNGSGVTALNISLPTIAVNNLTMVTKVKPDSVKTLNTATTPALGSINIFDMRGLATTGSMQLSAH